MFEKLPSRAVLSRFSIKSIASLSAVVSGPGPLQLITQLLLESYLIMYNVYFSSQEFFLLRVFAVLLPACQLGAEAGHCFHPVHLCVCVSMCTCLKKYGSEIDVE